jgi:putative ABC transport system permease protein
VIELARLAFLNLGKRRRRAFLTVLGIFIGIAAVVALVSIGQGLQQTLNAQFEEIGADKLFVQAKELGFTGELAPGPLTERELRITEDTNGVAQAAGELFRAVRIQYNDLQRTHFVTSIPPDAQEAELVRAFNTFKAEQGRLLSHKDRGKAVVGYNFARKKAFLRDIRVGDKLLVNDETFDVVGTLERIGDPSLDTGIVLAEEDVRRLVGDHRTYSFIVAQAARGQDPGAVAERVEKAIRRDRHQDEGKEDFSVQSFTDLIESFNRVFLIIQVVFTGIALISLLVGGIGIMNTMYTAVLERTREIGVMKAIGARNKDIFIIFVIESGLLGLAGGAVGVLIGAGISKAVELYANGAFGPGTLFAAFPPALIIGALAFSFIAGMGSGVLPAMRAAHLKPVDALRYE